jgi:ketosteroid isomerase-like protein
MPLSRPVGTADLATVADELAVQRVLAWNSQAINDGDRDAYLSTYVQDAVTVYWDRECHGHAEIGSYFDSVQKWIKVRNTITNVVVDVHGDTAWAVGTGTSVSAEVALPAILAQTTIETTFVKRDGIWRISHQVKRADASFDPAFLRGTVTNARSPDADVAKQLDALREAVISADSALLNRLVSDDFVGIGFAGQFVDKANYVAVHTITHQSEGSFSEFGIEHVVVETRGDVSTVHGIQSVTARIRLRSRFVQVWTRRGTAWQLSFHQETPIVDPSSVKSNY